MSTFFHLIKRTKKRQGQIVKQTSMTRFLLAAAKPRNAPKTVVTRANPIQNTTNTFTSTPYHK